MMVERERRCKHLDKTGCVSKDQSRDPCSKIITSLLLSVHATESNNILSKWKNDNTYACPWMCDIVCTITCDENQGT